MSGGGPGEPERIGSVIRDAQGNVLDNGSEANLPILKNKNQRGNHPNTLKFNKNPTQPFKIAQPEKDEKP